MKKTKLLLGFLILSFNCLWSQNTIGLPKIINFDNTTFQGGMQTWDIRQDEFGRMYFANNEGLLVYDGSYWKLYPQPNKTILRSVALDKKRIYAGGQDELGYYVPDNQGILKYTSLKYLIPKEYSSFTDVWDVEVYNQSVFFRTWERIFEYKDGRIQIYPALSGWEILKKAGGKLIAQDRKKGLFEFDGHQWTPMSPEPVALGFEVTGIVSLGNDSLLLSSFYKGLYTYYKGVLTRKSTEVDQSIGKNHIYCLEQINSTEFVLGTTSQGCLVINKSGGIVQQISRPEGLQNNNVLSVFLDKDNNLWTGLDNGISFIAYNSPIKYIKPGKPDEVSGYSARVFDNGLYIATSEGAYYTPLSPNATDLSFSKGDFHRLKNSDGQAWRLDEVNHQLLMGHHNGSYLVHKDQVIPLTSTGGAWLFLPESPVYPAKNILVGTYGGLLMLTDEGGKFVSQGLIKGMSESIRFFAADYGNIFWASHPYRGVYRIQLSPDKRSYTYELFTEKNGLPSTFRNNVFRVKNRVVFATERGIYEFDAASKKFIPSPLLFSVFGATMIQYLNEDADGNIWFSTRKNIGVVGFDPETNKSTVTYFPELTGKILSGFENIFPYNKENIFIASNTGIIHLNYKKYIIANTKPGMLLTQVKVSGKSDSLVFGGYFLRSSDSSKKTISNTVPHLPYNNNAFHFEFSSPSFGLQSNIDYMYQLKGYDHEWSIPSAKTEKEYTNLPEGYYTFEVKARDNLGNESETMSYSFVIKPAWYKTAWAYLFYIVLLGVLIYFLYRLQQRKFHMQQTKFEEEQARLKYIHQLEVEKNEKEIIQLQHEKLINEMIYKKKELADVSMHLVERSDALTKVKDELQRLQKKTGGDHDVQRALQLVNEIEKNNSNWEQFAAHFDEINNDFIKNLKSKFPSLTSTDLKVCTYLQMKLASKEIAQLMNISVRGVEISRYRLRKKLQLPTGKTLNDFLNEIHSGKVTE